MLRPVIFFLMMLSASVFAEALDKVVAIVNDDVITETELNQQAEITLKQMQSRQLQIPGKEALRKQVLQRMIDSKLQMQLAKANHLTVDDADLNKAIANIAKSNHMRVSQLREAITKEGISWERYRQDIRTEMLISQLQQKAVSKQVKLTPKQVDEHLKKMKKKQQANQAYHVINLIIPISDNPDKKQLEQARKKAYQLLNKAKSGGQFQSLAKTESDGQFQLESIDLGFRRLQELPDIYVDNVKKLHPGEIAGPIKAGNGLQLIQLVALQQVQDNAHRRITVSHTRHILIKQSPGTTAEETKKQVQNLYQQLKAGKDFAVMAKKYSFDAMSAKKGGDLGWVKPGETVPEFESAMNELKIKSISQPVQSPFGWHIIQVLERKKIDDSEAFERQQATQMLHQQKFYEAVQNWQIELRNDAYVQVIDKALG